MLALRRTAFTLAVALAFPVSATAAEKDTASVVGKVTFEGKPVAEGKVAFHPAKGRPVRVTTRADGSYSARGVPVGDVTVTVEGKGIPRKYASKDATPLRVAVKGGENTINLDLRR